MSLFKGFITVVDWSLKGFEANVTCLIATIDPIVWGVFGGEKEDIVNIADCCICW